MTRFLFAMAFALGATAVIWVGLNLPGSSPVALIATLLIAAVYAAGFAELLRFRQATGLLSRRLQHPPTSAEALSHWLADLPTALRGPVRRRIEGEPAALPGPTLTSYLTGLLVMLGLLGTFIGMIVTLRGAVSALEGGADLHAIRGALAAPIAGMSLAFGTSIAGVATSAMLGLAAALSRRERIVVSRELDTMLSHALQPFSLKHERQQTYLALQTLATRMDQMGERLSGALTGNQQQFHDGMTRHYEELARSVGDTLKTSLTESARLAAESTQPIMEAALAQLNQQVERTHRHLNETTAQQLTSLGEHFRTTTEQAAASWHSGLSDHQQASADLVHSISASLQSHNDQFQRHTGELLEQTRAHHQQLEQTGEQHLATLAERFQATTEQATENWRLGLHQQADTNRTLVGDIGAALENHTRHFQQTSAGLLNGQQAGLESLTARIGDQLNTLRDQEAARSVAAADRLASLEDTVTRHLAALGTALEEPMTRLIETASETPKAAAEVIRQLHGEMTRNSERDNQLLEERQRLMGQLDTLLSTQNETAASQRNAIEGLVRDSSRVLTEVGQAFSSQVSEQTAQLDEMMAGVTGSAHDVASLSDAFATAVQLFSAANDKLVDNLERIETALEQSSTRSDEQLAYYVEQAREVIDLSMTSQKDVLDALGALRAQGKGSHT